MRLCQITRLVLMSTLFLVGCAATRLATGQPRVTPIPVFTATIISPTAIPQLTPSLLPPSPLPIPSPTSSPTMTPTAAPPQHRIGVRVVGGDAQFYDRASGQRFVPRGATYTRLGPIKTARGVITYHTTFQVGTYDAARGEAALRQMADYGYNTVQVEVHGCEDRCVADPATGRLSGQYLDNVVDLMRRAKAHNLFVLLRVDDLPHGSSYANDLFVKHWRADIQGVNAQFLTAEGVATNAQYLTDLVRALIARQAPLDILLGYAVRGEAFLDGNTPPFTLQSGSLTAANGQKYNLADAQERWHMVDDAFVYFLDQVRTAIRAVDPTGLVGIGFFAGQTPHPWRVGDNRLVATRGLVTRSTADFLDLHSYPGEELTLPQFMENYGVDHPPARALLMSEFGAYKRTYGTARRAAQANAEWQSESCRYGYDGWLWWTWDTAEQDPPLWTSVEEGGTVADALSPIKRPDACAPWAGSPNIAQGKSVKASGASTPGSPASAAVDGLSSTWWTAGAFPPQWIEVDLGGTTHIARVALLVSQTPSGNTQHRILGRGEGEGWRLLHQFEGMTVDSQTLEATAPSPWLNIRYIRVETVKSPSWVGWREIEVYPPD